MEITENFMHNFFQALSFTLTVFSMLNLSAKCISIQYQINLDYSRGIGRGGAGEAEAHTLSKENYFDCDSV